MNTVTAITLYIVALNVIAALLAFAFWRLARPIRNEPSPHQWVCRLDAVKKELRAKSGAKSGNEVLSRPSAGVGFDRARTTITKGAQRAVI